MLVLSHVIVFDPDLSRVLYKLYLLQLQITQNLHELYVNDKRFVFLCNKEFQSGVMLGLIIQSFIPAAHVSFPSVFPCVFLVYCLVLGKIVLWWPE